MSAEEMHFTSPEDDETEPSLPAVQNGDAADPDEADQSTDTTPPQIVAETPIGGIPRPPLVASAGSAPAPEAEPAPPSDDALAAPQDEPAPETAEESALPPEPAIVDEGAAEQEPAPEAPPAEEAAPTPPTGPQPISEPPAPGAIVKTPAEAGPAAEPAEPIEPSPTLPSRPTEPRPLFSSQELARPDDWDDDLSPELAALLFGGADEAPAAEPETPPEAPAAPTEAEQAPAEAERTPTVPAPIPEPRPTPTPRRAPAIHLTDPEESRTLPITAGGVSSPAPEVRPEGKSRYVRIEEPLRGDNGQRISEKWEYRDGGARPKLNGRSLRQVKIKEVRYEDGSWLWRFERIYGDRGFDRRVIRANADRTYLERADEISAPDPTTGKRIKRREQEQMILAGPVSEAGQRRGLLSRLLRRGDEKDEPYGAKSWRAATRDESRHARRQGGMAF